MTTLGVVFRPQLPPEELIGLAKLADDCGLAELWLWEDCFLASGLASATAALASTSRLRVGIGIMPAPLRNVALAAMEVATVSRLFPGRLLPGFGHGVLDWMGQLGVRESSPMTLLREYLTAMQALLAGERVSMDGSYLKLDGVALDWPPLTPPPLYAAAVGPKTLALTGELADATLLDAGRTPAEVTRARAIIDQARTAASRPGRQQVTAYLIAATGPGAADRAAAEARRWNLDPAEDITVHGDAEAIADGIRRWAEAGVDTVILQPAADDPDLAGLIRLAAEQVQPLVG